MLFVSLTCWPQSVDVSPKNGHAEAHASNSYVLVLKKQAIARGVDFSQREVALRFGKENHLKDFIWFSTNQGCFAVTDTEHCCPRRDRLVAGRTDSARVIG
jgi:hypothetical protein